MAISGLPLSEGKLLDAIGPSYPKWAVYFASQTSIAGRPLNFNEERFSLALIADGMAVRPTSVVIGLDTYTTSLDSIAEADLHNSFPDTDYVSSHGFVGKPLVSANEFFTVQSGVIREHINAFSISGAYLAASVLAEAEAASRNAKIIGWLAVLYWKNGDPVLIHEDDWVCRMLVAAKSFP